MRTIVIILYIVLFLLSLTSKKANVFFFVFHLPIVPLVRTLGFIPLDAFFGYILFVRYLMDKHKGVPVELNRWHKSMIGFLVIAVIVCIINDIKTTRLLVGTLTSPLSHLLLAINFVITAFCINYVFHLVFNQNRYRDLITKALLFGALFLAISVLFSNAFYAMGLNIPLDSVNNDRGQGFYAGGDVNGLSGYYNMIVALILIDLFQKKGKKTLSHFFWLGILSISIVSTASRMGIITLGVLFVLYLFLQKRNLSGSIGGILVIILIAGIIYFSGGGQLAIDRFQNKGVVNDFDVENNNGRTFLWQYYLNYSFSSTETLLFGSDKQIYEFTPHNFFVFSLFNNGIIVVSLFIVSLLSFFYNTSKILKFTETLMLFVALVVSLMFLTSNLIIYICVIITVLLLANTYSDKYTLKT